MGGWMNEWNKIIINYNYNVIKQESETEVFRFFDENFLKCNSWITTTN